MQMWSRTDNFCQKDDDGKLPSLSIQDREQNTLLWTRLLSFVSFVFLLLQQLHHHGHKNIELTQNKRFHLSLFQLISGLF